MSMRKELRPAPAGPVLILGEALVDEFAEGPVAGGAPFNVARSLAALGGAPRLASRLNPEDAAGRCVLQSLRRFGLDERGLQLDLAHATGRVSVLEDGPGQHRFVIHANAAWDFLDAAPCAPWPKPSRRPWSISAAWPSARAARAPPSRPCWTWPASAAGAAIWT